MARRICEAIAILALLGALTACGSGVTFGVAPGPAEVVPKPPQPDSGPGPDRDSGPTPPPDGGECVPQEGGPATPEQLQATVTDGMLSAFQNSAYCTSCHTGGAAQGNFSYDPASKATLVASLTEAGVIEPGVSPEATTLGRYMNLGGEADGIHAGRSSNAGFSTTLRPEVEAFLHLASNGVEAVECPDAGPGLDCTPQPYPDADSRAYFDANLADATISCSSCHRASQEPVFDEAGAYDVMASRIEAGAASPEETTAGKIFRVNGASLQGHAFPFTEAEKAATWIQHHLDGVLPAGCE